MRKFASLWDGENNSEWTCDCWDEYGACFDTVETGDLMTELEAICAETGCWKEALIVPEMFLEPNKKCNE